MPAGAATLSVSFTEAREFRRLVDFVAEVETHAEQTDDYVLLALVDEMRDELAAGER